MPELKEKYPFSLIYQFHLCAPSLFPHPSPSSIPPQLLRPPLLIFNVTPLLTPHSQLRSLLNRPNLKFLPILLQHTLIMIFPELFRGVLARYALEDFGAAGVFVYEASNIIYTLINNDVHSRIGIFMRSNVCDCELF